MPSEAAYIPLLASHGLKPEALSLQSLFLDAAKHIPGAAKFKNVDEMVSFSVSYVCAVSIQHICRVVLLL